MYILPISWTTVPLLQQFRCKLINCCFPVWPILEEHLTWGGKILTEYSGVSRWPVKTHLSQVMFTEKSRTQVPSFKPTFSRKQTVIMWIRLDLFLHTVWCYISGGAAGQIWSWPLFGVKGSTHCSGSHVSRVHCECAYTVCLYETTPR